MSEVLYEANPSVWRMRPLGTVVSLGLVVAGLYVGLTGNIPYLAEALAYLRLPADADVRWVRWVGDGVALLGAFNLLRWWASTLVDHLEIRNSEIIWTHGLLSKSYTEINMDSVRTVRIQQSLFQRMVGAGDLVIFTTGDVPELSVKGLPRPKEIRDHIKRQTTGEV